MCVGDGPSCHKSWGRAAQHPQIPARALPTSSRSFCGALLRGLGCRASESPTAVLLWAERHTGPLQEGKHGPGHLLRAAGRAGALLQAELDFPQQVLPSLWRQVPALGRHLELMPSHIPPNNSCCCHFRASPQLPTAESWSHQLLQALQRSSNTDDTDVNTDTCMYSHTHSPHKSQSGIDLTHSWTEAATTKLPAWQFCLFGNRWQQNGAWDYPVCLGLENNQADATSCCPGGSQSATPMRSPVYKAIPARQRGHVGTHWDHPKSTFPFRATAFAPTLWTCGGSSSSELSSGTGSGCLADCPSSAQPPRGRREKCDGALCTVPGSAGEARRKISYPGG